MAALCPHGVAGDHLWCRESLALLADHNWHYAADNAAVSLPSEDPRTPAMLSWAHHKEGSHCPSIHMPRWASRITLEITEVRVQRLQDISEEDAKAEGVDSVSLADTPRQATLFYRDDFAQLWNKINGEKYPWSSNPWLWCLSFRRVA
jgi:hypothetical protein